LIVNQKDGKILCTAFAKGRDHDFELFKKSNIRAAKQVKILADSGYQGIQKTHSNAQTPRKATKLRPLDKADKKTNAELSKKRIKVENALAFIKRFKIFSTRYRNRRKRFGLRFNLFAAICNYEINLS
jgi:transposase